VPRARASADVADRQVDLAQQQHEYDPGPDDHDRRHLRDQVHEVARGEEVRVARLEVDRDHDDPDHDRERSELTLAERRDPLSRERRGRHALVGGCVGRRARRRWGS
jgi:hypothetical protein